MQAGHHVQTSTLSFSIILLSHVGTPSIGTLLTICIFLCFQNKIQQFDLIFKNGLVLLSKKKFTMPFFFFFFFNFMRKFYIFYTNKNDNEQGMICLFHDSTLPKILIPYYITFLKIAGIVQILFARVQYTYSVKIYEEKKKKLKKNFIEF